MSQRCALLILGSKGQRSRSWRMVIWKWFPDDNWLCNQPMIMKLHTLTHHESRMRPYWFWGQKVKGQGHGAWLFENGFRTITDSVINLWSWNFIHLLTMSQGCALLILRSKGQRSRSWCMVIWKWFPDDNWLCNQPNDHETSYTYSPWVKDAPYWFWGQKVKGQGHGAWLFENGFRTITDSVINLWSWNFIHLLTMSQGCALLILRSKGQRSRSWRMVIWKWFPDDNWLCNQPMIMKLHTLYSPWVKDVPYWFWGQKVNGQGHGAWLFENGPPK